jgi:hypothetical protein
MLGQIEHGIHYGIVPDQEGSVGGSKLKRSAAVAVELLLQLPWPDTGGEAADGGEVEIFVELDGGAVLCGHGEC